MHGVELAATLPLASYTALDGFGLTGAFLYQVEVRIYADAPRAICRAIRSGSPTQAFSKRWFSAGERALSLQLQRRGSGLPQPRLRRASGNDPRWPIGYESTGIVPPWLSVYLQGLNLTASRSLRPTQAKTCRSSIISGLAAASCSSDVQVRCGAYGRSSLVAPNAQPPRRRLSNVCGWIGCPGDRGLPVPPRIHLRRASAGKRLSTRPRRRSVAGARLTKDSHE